MYDPASIFIERLLALIRESRSQDQFDFDVVEGLAISGQAILIGRARSDRRVLGIAVDVESYCSLFAGSIELAADAFVIELQEPGWVKGNAPSAAAQESLATRFPGIWWVALGGKFA